MGKIVTFHLTRKAVYRAALKGIQKMYQLSGGGTDPIIDDASREIFERGEIDEVEWLNWENFCVRVLNLLQEQDPRFR